MQQKNVSIEQSFFQIDKQITQQKFKLRDTEEIGFIEDSTQN
jgi:hypothetical protein